MSTSPKPAAGLLASGVAAGVLAGVLRAFAEHTASGRTWDADEKAVPIYVAALVIALVSTVCVTIGVFRLVRHADDAAARAYFSGDGAESAAQFKRYLGGEVAAGRSTGSTDGTPAGTAARSTSSGR